MAQIPIPQFFGLPITNITDEADPTALEVNAFRTDMTTFTNATTATLNLGFPAHGYVATVPGNMAANASQANQVAQLVELHTYVQGYFNIYAQAHANFSALIASAVVAPPPPAAPHHQAPKSNLLGEFMGKSPTEAWHFIQQCVNYIVIQQFPDTKTKIWFVLALCMGDSAKWAHKQLIALTVLTPAPPQYLVDFDDFVMEFA